MVTRVNLLLIWMKKQGSECTHFILLLKEIFGKHLNVSQKFGDTDDKAFPFVTILCVCIFLCILSMYICVFYRCNLFVYAYVTVHLCCIF